MAAKIYLFFVSVCVLFIIGCTKDTKTNKIPVADAGTSKTITLPTDTVTFNGTGKDEDGKVVAYLWSQISGPAATTIVNPGSPSTSVKFVKDGNYIFQLMVVDDMGATGVDTAAVVVNPRQSKTITVQPTDNPYEYTVAVLNDADATILTNTSIDVDAWTKNSQLWKLRGLIKFDLSAIPSSAIIKSANLYLYSHPSPSTGNLVDANFGPANSFLIQQATSSWSPSNISWVNQPSVSTSNQIVVPATTQSKLDLNIDVTNMVASMVNNNANYGFLLRLENEVTYNSRIFVSSHNATYPDKHPKLVITYE